jgi:hypothetical protein
MTSCSTQVRLVALATFVTLSLGCESTTSLNPLLADGGVTDVLVCSFCADVSVDADYDAPDVSIYGIPSMHAADGGTEGGASDAQDATLDGHD